MNPTPDVLIAGAGPAGLALATALAKLGRRVTVFEQQPRAAVEDPADDGREIALTHRARRVLQALGHWERLPEDEISLLVEARVSSGTSPFVLPFEARAAGHDNLGWLVPNRLLRRAAWEAAAAEEGVSVVFETRVTGFERSAGTATLHFADGREATAPLVVAADSRFSGLRRLGGIGADMLDFGRTAIVGPLAHERDHGGVAHECFRYGNTLATLPMTRSRSSAVVTLKSDEAPAWMALDDDTFARRVQAQLAGRLGAMSGAGARHAYPLVAVYAHRFAKPRFALVGDAAVGMHPVTAHGYNFGLYGVEVMAREIGASGDPGRESVLARYADEHRRTTGPIYAGTNAVVRLFTDDRPPARLLRGAVLRAAKALPPVTGFIRRQLTGSA